LTNHKDGYDFCVMYGTTRNRCRTSFFYKGGKLRKEINFIWPTQKSLPPHKVILLYNNEEEKHNMDGPAFIISCLEHRCVYVEEYFYKNNQIPKEGLDLLTNMVTLKSPPKT